VQGDDTSLFYSSGTTPCIDSEEIIPAISKQNSDRSDRAKNAENACGDMFLCGTSDDQVPKRWVNDWLG